MVQKEAERHKRTGLHWIQVGQAECVKKDDKVGQGQKWARDRAEQLGGC